MNCKDDPEISLNSTACPRCNCWIKKSFICNCGMVHSDYCINCFRFTDNNPKEHIKLEPYDAVCDKGAVLHQHSSQESSDRFKAYIKNLKD